MKAQILTPTVRHQGPMRVEDMSHMMARRIHNKSKAERAEFDALCKKELEETQSFMARLQADHGPDLAGLKASLSKGRGGRRAAS